jgi:hypothetical protein
VGDGYSGFQVIDISDPNNLRIVSFCDTPGSAYDIYVTGTNAYMADGGSGFQAFTVCEGYCQS